MSKLTLCFLLILNFLQTGRTNSRVSLTQKRENRKLTLTCDLFGDDSVSQVNWERVRGSNRTTVGIFHYQHGTYITPEEEGSAEISGHSPSGSTHLTLKGALESNETLYCCVLVAFPSGTLESCTAVNMVTTEAEPQGTDRRWKMLFVGATLLLLMLTASLYLFHSHYGNRRQMFELQRTSLTDRQIDSEESIEGPQAPPEDGPRHVFDPSKLYTKIKIDYYYERLWKAYQGKAHGWPHGAQTGRCKIYYLVGGHVILEKDEEDLLQV